MEKQRENQIEQDELFRFWFAGLKGIGNREKIQLTKEFPQKNTLYYIEETALKKRLKEKWTEGKAETITQIIQEESTQQVKEGQSTEAEEHLVFLEAVWIFAIQKRIEDSMKI